jgi:hypothetical protein
MHLISVSKNVCVCVWQLNHISEESWFMPCRYTTRHMWCEQVKSFIWSHAMCARFKVVLMQTCLIIYVLPRKLFSSPSLLLLTAEVTIGRLVRKYYRCVDSFLWLHWKLEWIWSVAQLWALKPWKQERTLKAEVWSHGSKAKASTVCWPNCGFVKIRAGMSMFLAMWKVQDIAAAFCLGDSENLPSRTYYPCYIVWSPTNGSSS